MLWCKVRPPTKSPNTILPWVCGPETLTGEPGTRFIRFQMRSLRRMAIMLFLGLTVSIFAATVETPRPAPRQVEVDLYILDIAEIDEPGGQFAMHVLLSCTWKDATLAFEGTEPRAWREEAAMEQVNANWRPMVEFNRTAAPVEIEHMILRIYPDGRVEFERQMNIRIATALDLRKLPFDTQRLRIELESFQHQADVLELSLPPENLHMTKEISLTQWQPGRTTTETGPKYSEVYDETYSRATVTIEVTRRYQYYIWQMMVPLGILVAMAFAVFYLPPTDLADRMNVIIASLLTVVALSYSLHTDLPKVPYLTVIDWLFLLAYVFLGLSMVGMVWVRRLHDQNEAQALRLDRWLRWGYPIAYLLFAGGVVVWDTF